MAFVELDEKKASQVAGSVPDLVEVRPMPELGKKVLLVGRQLLAWVGLVVLFSTVYSCPAKLSAASSETPRVEPRILPGFFDTVIVDPGHGGSDEGASGHNLKEKMVTMELAHRNRGEMNALGFTRFSLEKGTNFVSLPSGWRSPMLFGRDLYQLTL